MRGSVIKRGQKWSVVIDVGRDSGTGKRIREWHSGYNTRKEAEQARTALLHALDNGGHVSRSSVTFEQYLLEEWLPSRKPRQQTAGRGHRGQLGVGSYGQYEYVAKTYIIPRLGKIRLQDLTGTHLDGLYDDLEENGRLRDGRGLATNTIVGIHTVVHKALTDAVRRRRVARNVADDVAPPRAARVEMPVWSVEELRTFLTHVRKDRMYAAWLLFSTTGMRRGEVAGLAWPDLDLALGKVRIDWTLGLVNNEPTWKPGAKSKAGERVMSLDPATVSALKERQHTQEDDREAIGAGWTTRNTDWRGLHREGLVFTWEDGRMLNPRRISGWFHRHREKAGLPRIRLHDVRHTYATAGLQNARGWHEVKVISQRLGHASIGITLDTYSHVLPAADEEVAHTLAQIILGEQEA